MMAQERFLPTRKQIAQGMVIPMAVALEAVIRVAPEAVTPVAALVAPVAPVALVAPAAAPVVPGAAPVALAAVPVDPTVALVVPAAAPVAAPAALAAVPVDPTVAPVAPVDPVAAMASKPETMQAGTPQTGVQQHLRPQEPMSGTSHQTGSLQTNMETLSDYRTSVAPWLFSSLRLSGEADAKLARPVWKTGIKTTKIAASSS